MEFDSVWVRIDLDAIEKNIAAVRRKTGSMVMAVVKADAYGHGAVSVARALADRCEFFGVSSLAEALELRNAGIGNPILMLGRTRSGGFEEAVRLGLRPTIFRWEDALELSRAAVAAGVTAPFHFAVDTGMSRLGFQATQESADLCVQIAKLPGLEAEGIFSHFASADSGDLERAKAQAALFDWFCSCLEDRGLHIPLRHMNNSAGLMNFGNHYDMVRSGIVTYGLYPSEEVSPGDLPLEPAMSWHSQVSFVKTLPPGREISYGGTFVTERESVIATVPVGYADGYRRGLSNRFHVLINGKKAPILGRVCMDQLMVDVTDIGGVDVGTEVTLVGRNGEESITVEEMAAAAGSFNYELVCGISRRVPRYYYKGGEKVREVHYLFPE